MGQTSISKIMKLILMLASNGNHSIQSISRTLDVSIRTAYRYLESLKKSGFSVEKNESGYSIFFANPNLQGLSQTKPFTDAEVEIFDEIIQRLDNGKSGDAEGLRKKLLFFFNKNEEIFTGIDNSNKIRVIEHAIENKHQVRFENYRSSHSNQFSNHIVEPFKFANSLRTSIWCFEPRGEKNKVFKISRIESLTELENNPWKFEDAHHASEPDIFNFSGDDVLPLRLRLNAVSYNAIIDSFPQSRLYLRFAGNAHWTLNANVHSYIGPTRFYLGLAHDIDILDNPEFVDYLRRFVHENLAFLL